MMATSLPRPLGVSTFPRGVVAISSEAQRTALLKGLVDDTDGFDSITLETLPRSYARIRELLPDLVILLMEIDDADACQLLTMLAADPATSRIPVITCYAEPAEVEPASCLPAQDLLSRIPVPAAAS
jgi:CheY-like chemotaxis protein